VTATERPRGPRARTRERLRDAFLSTLAERGYERLRIADVLARASVGRSTFYEHFRDKEALLESTLGRFAEALTHAAENDPRPFGFLRALLEHVRGQRALFLKLKSSRSGALVLGRLQRLVRERLATDLAREGLGGAGPSFDLGVEHATAGLFGLIEAWLRRYPELSAAELEQAFLSLTRGGASGVSRAPDER